MEKDMQKQNARTRPWAPTADRESGYPARFPQEQEGDPATNQDQARAVVAELFQMAESDDPELNYEMGYEARTDSAVMLRLAGGGPGYTLTFIFRGASPDGNVDERDLQFAVLDWHEFGGTAYEVIDEEPAKKLWAMLNRSPEEAGQE